MARVQMYASEPMFEMVPGSVQLPTIMYHMESIMPELAVSSAAVGSVAGGSSRLEQLAARQQRIIQEAQALTDQVEELLKKAGVVDTAEGKHGQSMPSGDRANKLPAGTDVTVTANTATPPRTTLLVAAHLKSGGMTFRTRQFWHSTNGPMPAGFREANPPHNDSCDLRINIIWKPEPATVTRMSASTHAPLMGDITAARHLCRIFKSSLYPDSDAVAAAQVDEWIDQAATLDGPTKEVKTVLKNLNQTLGKASYLVGNQLTLADMAIWGGLRTHVTAALPSNVKKWAADMDETNQAGEVTAILACVV